MLSPIACSSLDLFKDKEGNTHTQAGDTIMTVGKTMQEVGGAVPGYGTLIGLIGGLVVMAGGLVTSVKKAISNGNMLDTVITGIREANTESNVPEMEKVISKVATHRKVAKKLRDRMAKVAGDPKIGV